MIDHFFDYFLRGYLNNPPVTKFHTLSDIIFRLIYSKERNLNFIPETFLVDLVSLPDVTHQTLLNSSVDAA